jgi:hypothetical protein
VSIVPDAVTNGDILLWLAVIAAIAGAWWRVEALVKASKADMVVALAAAEGKGSVAIQQVAELRVHIAETYASKGGVREMSDRLEQGNKRIFEEMQRLHERMDRIIAERPR